MTTSLDINILPLARDAGVDQPDMAGLYAAEPPRRAARSRGADRLILYLSLLGNNPLPRSKQDQVLEQLAQTYYKSSGSVTSALRTAAEKLNSFLLDRNLRSASSGQQSIGLLTLAVVRGGQLYLAQSGPVHAFIVNGEGAQHVFDPQLSGRGLGLTRTTPLRYFHASLSANDCLVLAGQPSTEWKASTLIGLRGEDPEGSRKTLLLNHEINLDAVLVCLREGTGAVQLIQSPPAPSPALPDLLESAPGRGSDGKSKQPVSVTKEAPAAQPPAAPDSMGQHSPEEKHAPDASAAGEPASAPAADPAAAPAADGLEEDLEPDRPVAPAEDEGSPKTTRAASPKVDFSPAKTRLAASGAGFARAFQSLARELKSLLRHILPDESIFTLPASTMAFFAVAVPLVVVTIASVVYLQKGRSAQYDVLFQRAQQTFEQAAGLTNAQDQRAAWESVLYDLNQAEAFQTTPASKALRAEAQQALDALDLLQRVEYRSAIAGGLPDAVKVSRMVIFEDDLYLLDQNSGNVLRAQLTNQQTYQLDLTFQCGPGFYEGHSIGPMIDIAPPPPGVEPGAVLTGIDAAGSVAYCFPADSPEAAPLAQPYTAPQWGNLAGLTVDLDKGHLYILDPADRAVWAYWGSNLEESPEFYFGDQVPEMEDVVDLAVDKKDLYLLHADGSMSVCTYSGMSISPTRCEETVPYLDTRPGRINQPFVPRTPFAEVLYTPPPDPSLYFLEPETHGIGHFSLRTLSYHRQFFPASGTGTEPATAFAVNQLQRMLFLAVGNQVYQASMP